MNSTEPNSQTGAEGNYLISFPGFKRGVLTGLIKQLASVNIVVRPPLRFENPKTSFSDRQRGNQQNILYQSIKTSLRGNWLSKLGISRLEI